MALMKDRDFSSLLPNVIIRKSCSDFIETSGYGHFSFQDSAMLDGSLALASGKWVTSTSCSFSLLTTFLLAAVGHGDLTWMI